MPVTRLYDATPQRLNAFHAVCIGLYLTGDSITVDCFGANRLADAQRAVRRLRREGQPVFLRWVNVGAWCRDLWVQDLARPRGRHPEKFYGALESPNVQEYAA